jgi:hypothetical protein
MQWYQIGQHYPWMLSYWFTCRFAQAIEMRRAKICAQRHFCMSSSWDLNSKNRCCCSLSYHSAFSLWWLFHLCNDQYDHKNDKTVLIIAFANLSHGFFPDSFVIFHFLFQFALFSQNLIWTVIHKLKLFHFHLYGSKGLKSLSDANLSSNGDCTGVNSIE